MVIRRPCELVGYILSATILPLESCEPIHLLDRSTSPAGTGDVQEQEVERGRSAPCWSGCREFQNSDSNLHWMGACRKASRVTATRWTCSFFILCLCLLIFNGCCQIDPLFPLEMESFLTFNYKHILLVLSIVRSIMFYQSHYLCPELGAKRPFRVWSGECLVQYKRVVNEFASAWARSRPKIKSQMHQNTLPLKIWYSRLSQKRMDVKE